MKIGPVDTEIALLIVKKEEITEGKIYSPVGRFAERAKLGLTDTFWTHVGGSTSYGVVYFRCLAAVYAVCRLWCHH